MSEENEIQPSEKPSKSQRKKDMTGLQELGHELTKLKRVQLDKIPLSTAMAGAIIEFTRLNNSHEARRRQLQYIGKLMRKEDHEEISMQLQKLRKFPLHKFRVKNYRGIVSIANKKLIINIVKIKHRNIIYKGLDKIS